MHHGKIMLENQVILLNGTSSSGKSSIAKQLQFASGNNVAHIHIDMFLDMFNFRYLTDVKERVTIVNTAINLFHSSISSMCEMPYPIVVDTVFQDHGRYEELIEILHNKRLCFVFF